MTPTQLRLYELLGDKTLSFGCLVRHNSGGEIMRFVYDGFTPYSEYYNAFVSLNGRKSEIKENYIIIGHEPTLTDLNGWFVQKWKKDYCNIWGQNSRCIYYWYADQMCNNSDCGESYQKHGWDIIDYDSSKKLIDQSE